MKKITVLLFLFLILFINHSYADYNFSEDDGAYWYLKFCEKLPKGVNTSTSLKEFNESGIATLENFNIDYLKDILNILKKAKSLEKCSLFEKEQNSKNINYLYTGAKEIEEGLKAANELAWYCVSINKPDLAGYIWISLLEFAKKSANNNIISNRLYAANYVTFVIKSLNNYFENGASDDFKNKFLKYLNNWPKDIFDLKNSIETTYDYSKKEIKNRESDMNKLAQWVSWARNMQCKSQLDKVAKALNTHCGFAEKDNYGNLTFKNINNVGETNYCNLDWSQIVEELLKENSLKSTQKYDCPNEGKRTVKLSNRLYSDISKSNKYYKGLEYTITCDCVNKLDYNEDSVIMKFAVDYKNKEWENAKNLFDSFYNKTLEIASSNNNEDISELEIPLTVIQKNIFLMHLGFSYGELKSSFSNVNEKLDSFLKKYKK